MRIEIDDELGQLLDQIKAKEHSIYGRGHADTVRFLANYYQNHKAIQETLKEITDGVESFLFSMDTKIDVAIENALLRAFGRAISRILSVADENRTDKRSPAALQEPGAVR